MRILTILAIAAAVNSSAACFTAAPSTEPAQQEIQAQYDRWLPAVRTGLKDRPGLRKFMEGIYAEDFRAVDKTGQKQDRKQRIDGYLAAATSVRAVDRWGVQVVSITTMGPDRVQIEQRYDIRLRAANPQDPGDRKVHVLQFKGRGRDTWVKAKSGWRIQDEVQLASDDRMDGQPLPPDTSQVKAELNAWYEKIVAAYRLRDTEAYAALFTPDVELVTWDGKRIRGRRALAAWAKGDMEDTDSIESATCTFDDIEVNGKTVRWTATETWKQTMRDSAGTYGPKAKAYDVVWRQTSRAQAVRTADGWRLQSGRYIDAPDMRVNGKPLVPISPKPSK